MQSESDSFPVLNKQPEALTMNIDKTDKPNQEETDLQEKTRDFPKVFVKFYDGEKICITGRVKQPQQVLSAGASSSYKSNWDSKHLDMKKKEINTPKTVFKQLYVKIPRLPANVMELYQRKKRLQLTPVRPKSPNVVKGSKVDDESDAVSDLFSTSSENTNQCTLRNKKQELKRRKEVLPANTILKFNQMVERIIQSTNNNDSTKIGDVIIQDEHLLNRSVMEQLVDETAKLKASGATKTISVDTLLGIINVMELNIKGGDQIIQEGLVERVLGAANACLVCLYIMTSPNMPKRIYLEDVINRVVLCIKYQLEKIILPTFDITYELENKTDGTKDNSLQIPEGGIQVLFDKALKLINLLAEFLSIQLLTDSLVLEVSSMTIPSFFVAIPSNLQPACLKIITTIFTRYENHRMWILEQILAYAVRVSNSKNYSFTYKLGKENINVLTALVLQLIQCVAIFPETFAKDVLQGVKGKKVNKDNLICNKYEKARTTAVTFLNMFLNHCAKKSEDTDHKSLFESFIQDLMLAVNKPKWPASVLLLNLLERILAKRFSDKEADVFLRGISLDYLGLILVWLRKAAILDHDKMADIDRTVKKMKGFDKEKHGLKEEKIQFLQDILLEFLVEYGKDDRTVRDFYIAQWYTEATDRITVLLGDKATKPKLTNSTHKRKRGQDGTDVNSVNITSLDQNSAKKYRKLEARKMLLLNKLQSCDEYASAKNDPNNIDPDGAGLITQYLVSERNVSENFNQYLKAILLALKEPAIAIRIKVLKFLSTISAADPSLLARNDVQMGINYSFLDPAPLVRETVLDVVGKFVLSQPELLDKYYEPLSARILDTSAGVRKKVIRVLKDICVERPHFSKIPEICVKMIRRVGDDGGVGKLVVDVFQNMWFTPETKSSVLHKVTSITDAVAVSQGVGLIWFEQLLENIFKPKQEKFGSTRTQNDSPKPLLSASKQIVDCLMENILKLTETHNTNPVSSPRFVSYSTTLHLFAKIRPQLLVKHAQALLALLNLKCRSKDDVQIIGDTARTLAWVVPLIPNPRQAFLAQLEQDCLKLMLQHDRPVVVSFLTCLGSIINNVTHNFDLARHCFVKYYEYLAQIKLRTTSETTSHVLDDVKYRQYFKRALFIVGLLFQHFDFKDKKVIGDLSETIIDEVFEVFLVFLQQPDEDIQANAVKAVGAICTRHFEFMLEKNLQICYQRILASADAPLAIKSGVLVNIESYLVEEDQRMMQDDLKWKNRSRPETLKKMDDMSSGMASTVIQQYLKEILESYLDPNIQVREPALRVVQLIMQQGLVHPIQIVPYLICMGTDCEEMVSHAADKQLLELERKYPGLMHTKSSLGIKLSYRLQKILQQVTLIRGFRLRAKGEHPISLNGYLYSILRSSRQQRRGLILNMLKQFDEEGISVSYMLYLADNVAYFPYVLQDEPLFIIHHIDMMISVTGTNLLQSFREGLNGMEAQEQPLESAEKDPMMKVSALDEDDDKEGLLARLPEDTSSLQAYLKAAQGCLLLLVLKQHLKDAYGLNDEKIRQYSPIESEKICKEPINHKRKKLFNPMATINKLQEEALTKNLDEEGRKSLINQYLEFKQLMLKLDRDDNDDKINGGNVLTGWNSPRTVAMSTSTRPNSILVESGQVKSQNRVSNTDNKQKTREFRTPKKNKTPKPKKKRRKVSVYSDEETGNESGDSDFVP